MGKPVGFFIGPDKRSGRMPIDENCIPTYEGGCPSRFVRNGGYPNYAGTGIFMNKTGYSYDGLLLSKDEPEYGFTFLINQHEGKYDKLMRLMNAIDERAKNYGN